MSNSNWGQSVLLESIGTFFDRYKGYLFGKAALMLAVGLASTLLGVSIFWPAMIAVVGGAGLQIYGRLTQQRYYEDEMVNLYRDDIASHLGKAPEEVTRSDLKVAAKDNEILAQALARQNKNTFISIGTTLLASAVTLAILLPFGDTNELQRFVAKDLGLGNILGQFVSLIGIGTVSGISNIFLHNGLSAAIGQGMGTNKAAAHDLIESMETDVQRGKPITREQVYGALVAGNTGLQQAIQAQYHRPYARMNHAQQSYALHQIGVAQDMDALATAINQGEMRPGRLAYLMDDAMSLRKQATDPTPAQSNFVERLNLQPARNKDGFAAQIDSERADIGARAI